MDRDNALEYITRVDWRHSRLGLERIAGLMERLGNPQDGLRFIHVAGTNGKGSVSAMLASVLMAGGYKTGLYTSPYINCFNERMQVDGVMISDGELADVTTRVRAAAEQMEDHPTEFELVTAIAFLWFASCGCDIVVLEVGLGGRLDATNVIKTPLLAVITTIALDHTTELGGTLPEIAAEKAGIIKPGGRVLAYPAPPQVQKVFRAACTKVGASLTVANLDTLTPGPQDLCGQGFSYGGLRGLRLSLLGPYQLRNAALVINAAWLLRQAGLQLRDDAIEAGLAATSWPARFEVVSTAPAVVVDGGHNLQGAEVFAEGLRLYFPQKKVLLLTGVMVDKDYGATYRAIKPLVRQAFCVAPDNPRALPADALAACLGEIGIPASAFLSVEAGLAAALAVAGAEDVVCAFGTFYIAGQVRRHFVK